MFVPSEGVYYELLMTQDSKYGRLDGILPRETRLAGFAE